MAIPFTPQYFGSKPDEEAGVQTPVTHELGDAPDLTRLMRPTGNAQKVVCASWSSLEKFATSFKGDTGQGWWCRDNVHNDWHTDFNGCESFQHALDLAMYGWKEGGETIERTRSYVRALNPISLQRTRYGIAGTSPNVPRAIAGNPLNMRLPEVGKSRKKQVITIVYNMCENGGTDKDIITNKAAVTAALIDEIEAKGFACEVVAAVVTGYNWKSTIKAFEFVRIKESHLPVDINRLAFGLGHAAMFRGLFFGDMQRYSEFKEIGPGLGCATTTFPTKELLEQQIYTITSTNKASKSKQFATVDLAVTEGLNAIVRELQMQGCPAFPALSEKDHTDDLEKQSEEDDEDEYDDDF